MRCFYRSRAARNAGKKKIFYFFPLPVRCPSTRRSFQKDGSTLYVSFPGKIVPAIVQALRMEKQSARPAAVRTCAA